MELFVLLQREMLFLRHIKIDINKVSLSRGAFLSLAKPKLYYVAIKYK